jgi:uncharacterized membrane protein
MSEEIHRQIDDFIRRTQRLLPSGFETEDLLEDLRSHIEEAFREKMRTRSEDEMTAAIQEVLDELGSPEDIAEEYSQSSTGEDELEERRERNFNMLGRLLFAILVVVVVSFFLSTYTGGTLEFWFTLIVLLVFVIAEWFVRAWQAGESSPLGVLKSK